MSERSATDELARWLVEWYPSAYRTAWLILGDARRSEDAVQEAFLRLWRFRDALPAGAGARPWLYRIVVNSCYSLARHESRHDGRAERGGENALDRLCDPAPGTEELVLLSDQATAVREALQQLPETLRAAVVLRYYGGLSEREIAVAIRRRPGTVKSRLHEARRLLSADPRLSTFAGAASQAGTEEQA